MILVDSSAWIEYYRNKGNSTIQDLVTDSIRNDETAVNGIITVEIAGFARDNETDKVLADFSAFHQLELSPQVFAQAVSICADLRHSGTTVPATDAIIAASALVHRAEVIHLDHHFAEIAKRFPLTCHSTGV